MRGAGHVNGVAMASTLPIRLAGVVQAQEDEVPCPLIVDHASTPEGFVP